MDEEQLIIIGNGFDVNSGLKSLYSQFIDFALTDEKRYDILSLHAENNFFFLLIDKLRFNYKDWCNIEDVISKTLIILDNEFTSYDYFEKKQKNEWGDLYASPCDFMLGRSRDYGGRAKEKYPGTEFSNKLKEIILYEIATNDMFKRKAIDNPDVFFSLLKKEVSNFELLLGRYLRYITHNNSNYECKSKNLLKKLYTNNFEKNVLPAKILSFNYTPIPDITKSSHEILLTKNVHGSIENYNETTDLVIGVDRNQLSSNATISNSLTQFTKTYRTLKMHHDLNFIGSEAFVNKKIKVIKFFGHSLSLADYSYFQSVFDALDIYNNEIYIFFYYSNYDSVDRSVEQFDKVFQLMEYYGKNMANLNHGRNLLHKLELENRLSITEI